MARPCSGHRHVDNLQAQHDKHSAEDNQHVFNAPYKYNAEVEDFLVKKVAEGRFELSGKRLLKEFRMLDFNNENAAYHFARNLRIMGVDTKLRALGAVDGDSIIIDGYESEFIE